MVHLIYAARVPGSRGRYSGIAVLQRFSLARFRFNHFTVNVRQRHEKTFRGLKKSCLSFADFKEVYKNVNK